MPPNHQIRFENLPLTALREDPDQPRTVIFGPDGEIRKDHFFLDISEEGILRPLEVTQIDKKNKYRIIDGHRRYRCAKELKLRSVPCIIYPELPDGTFARLQYKIQTKHMPWKPLERSDALARVKKDNKINSQEELAKCLGISRSVVTSSLDIREQNRKCQDLVVKYDLSETYAVEFFRLKPKIDKVRDFEIMQTAEILFRKVQRKVIKNAKDFRDLHTIFLHSDDHEDHLYSFLTKLDTTVDELKEKIEKSEIIVFGRKFLQTVGTRQKNGEEISEEERDVCTEIYAFLTQSNLNFVPSPRKELCSPLSPVS